MKKQLFQKSENKIYLYIFGFAVSLHYLLLMSIKEPMLWFHASVNLTLKESAVIILTACTFTFYKVLCASSFLDFTMSSLLNTGYLKSLEKDQVNGATLQATSRRCCRTSHWSDCTWGFNMKNTCVRCETFFTHTHLHSSYYLYFHVNTIITSLVTRANC